MSYLQNTETFLDFISSDVVTYLEKDNLKVHAEAL